MPAEHDKSPNPSKAVKPSGLSLGELLQLQRNEPATEKNITVKLSQRLSSLHLTYGAKLKESHLSSTSVDYMFSKEGTLAATEIAYLEEINSALRMGLSPKKAALLYNECLQNNHNCKHLEERLTTFRQDFKPKLPTSIQAPATHGDLYPLRNQQNIPVKIIILEPDDGKLTNEQLKLDSGSEKIKKLVELSDQYLRELSQARCGMKIESIQKMTYQAWTQSYQHVLVNHRIKDDGQSLIMVFGPKKFLGLDSDHYYAGKGKILSATDRLNGAVDEEVGGALVHEILHGLISGSHSKDPKSLLISDQRRNRGELYIGLTEEEANYLQWPRNTPRRILP